MAETYTSNLGLTKPDYDSPADISVINSNMDKIDSAVANAGKVKSVNGKTGDVALAAADVGALGKNETAANAKQLNGKSADKYMLKTDTAADSDKLGGVAASEYATKSAINGEVVTEVEKRIAQITDSDAADMAEVISARTDENGVVHPSLKTRVDEGFRSQKILTADDRILKSIIDASGVTNAYITNTGKEYAYNAARTSGYVDITVCDVAYYTGNATDSGIALWVAYDEGKNVVAYKAGSAELSNVKRHEIDLEVIRAENPTAKYIRFCSVYNTALSVNGLCVATPEELVGFLKSQNILYGKKYVACGDSFTEGLFGEAYKAEYYDNVRQYWKTYPWYIAERNNMTLVNEAKSGTTMWNNGSNAFSGERYKNIPTDADYITLMFGMNETDAPIGTLQDSTTETVMGAWNVVLEYLIEKHPFAKIGMIIADSWLTKDLHDAMIQIAEYWGIPYLDLRNDTKIPMGINGRLDEVNPKAKALRDAAFKMSSDNGHPNPKAHEYRSTFIEHWMRSL